MGDINIDSHDCKSIGYKELTNFMTTFSLKNLIKDKTCFSKDHESSIDLILTNKSESFLKSHAFELGLSDCHKMINATLRAHIPRIKTKFISYRTLKDFDKEKFLEDLSKFTNTYTCNNINNDYEKFINHFIELLDKHTPLKKKKVRGYQSRFMSKELSKAIMKRSLLRSKYLKNRNN